MFRRNRIRTACFSTARLLLTTAALSIPASVAAQTQNLNLAWNANPEPDIASYYVHVGTSPGNYNIATTPVPGNQTTYAFPATPGVRYYFALKAVNEAGIWSPSSAEIVGGVPTLTQPANQSGTVGTAITPLQLIASDPDGGTLQFSAANLPSGLGISSSGRITGTPTTASTRTVTASVFDGTVTVQRSFTWTISGDQADVKAVSSTPSSGTGSTQTFTLVHSDSLGAADLAGAAVQFAVNSSTMANTCHLTYNTANSVMSLLEDGGTSWHSATLGTDGTLGNSQCSLALGSSTVVSSGVNLTMTLAMTFKPPYAGTKNIFMLGKSAGGASTGWQDRGDWTVPAWTLGLTSNTASPRVAGTSVTFTATASGGVAPYQFKYWLFDGATWTIVRNWGGATFTWTPTVANANYRIGVWARDSTTTADVNTYSLSVPYAITASPSSSSLAVTGLSANLASPRVTGTAISFTASATGGTAPYQFKWWLFDGITWTMVQNWGGNTLAWTPTVANAHYRVGVWARDSTTTADINTHNLSVPYVITGAASSAPLAITGLSADLTSPRVAGTAITFTASATGGIAPHQFKWWLFDGITWTMVQNWGGNTFTWTPTVAGANYRIGIWARAATTSADSSLHNLSVPYKVTASSGGPVAISALTRSVATPSAGTAVTFTASATGGTAPYQFKWWLFDGISWTMLRNWGSDTFTWTPAVANANYRVGIWARDAPTTSDVSDVNLSISVPVAP